MENIWVNDLIEKAIKQKYYNIINRNNFIEASFIDFACYYKNVIFPENIFCDTSKVKVFSGPINTISKNNKHLEFYVIVEVGIKVAVVLMENSLYKDCYILNSNSELERINSYYSINKYIL